MSGVEYVFKGVDDPTIEGGIKCEFNLQGLEVKQCVRKMNGM